MKFILAKKIGMSTIFSDGIARNVTLLEVGKNVVTTIRNQEKDGYSAVQVSLANTKTKKGSKKFLKTKEVRIDSTEGFKVNDELKIDQFQINDKVSVTGISKGKGFQGVVKRHNFSGSTATHGHRHDQRAPGSIGSAFPERVFKGKKMAGRMGFEQATLKNLKVALVDIEKELIAVEGSVPGNNGAIVRIYQR